ncbi:18 kDa heat shock protein [Scheffersomyces xylosifermentans]|uniref:18 kDa heat shock protein n=1 Tax=Scheffersomyces xylosifermentans TaxID=1304137 RepID=UPI00315DBB45
MFGRNIFDSDFDNFFGSSFFSRPRRYESRFPRGYYSPRFLIDSAYPEPQGANSQVTRREYDNDFLAHFQNGRLFAGFDNDVVSKEESDKYVVTFKVDDLKNKNIKVDFLKAENELTLSGEEKKEEEKDGVKSSYTNNFHSSVRFDKPVKSDAITAAWEESTVVITIPKVKPDTENIVNIPIKGDNLIEPKPAEQNQAEGAAAKATPKEKEKETKL